MDGGLQRLNWTQLCPHLSTLDNRSFQKLEAKLVAFCWESLVWFWSDILVHMLLDGENNLPSAIQALCFGRLLLGAHHMPGHVPGPTPRVSMGATQHVDI